MIIDNYQELEDYVKLFRDGKCQLLCVISDGGLGKTQLISSILETTSHVRITSHTSALALYIVGYENRNTPFWFDDVNEILSDKSKINLLKAFAETIQDKKICWYTTSEKLNEETPQEYFTKSRVIITANDIDRISKKARSLFTRGIFIVFKPTYQEIMNKMKEIIPLIHEDVKIDKKIEVLAEINKWSYLVKELNLRHLVIGIELQQQFIDWKDRIMKVMELDEKLLLLDKLMQQYGNDTARLQYWKYARSTFYECKRMLKERKPIIEQSAVI